jgi:glycosyltransferase involved in cell wall biosynthesis
MGRNYGSGETSIIALLPFLVKGALSLSLLRAMRDRGFDVTIAYYMSAAAGYTRDPLEDFETVGRLLNMVNAPGMIGVRRLEQIIRDREISLLLQIGAPGAYRQIPYLKERLANLRTLDTLYNPVGHTVNHFLYEGGFDGVIVESVAMRDFVLANSSKRAPKVHVVLSGIALDEFTPSPRQEMTPEPFTVGYVGRMSPEKNPIGFVEIAERLHAEIPTLCFSMFGEGGMQEGVRARAGAGPAASAIAFEGYAAHARDGLRAVDLLVVPSKLDGRPNVIMEANACGVPVIAAPVGGIPELIEDGVNGYLVAPHDHARIAGLIRGWVEKPEIFVKLRQSSRAKAERDFDRRRMLDDYANVFAGIPEYGADFQSVTGVGRDFSL